MDFRDLPNATRWDRLRHTQREELPGEEPLSEARRNPLPLCSLALYLLALAIIGLPLVFPTQYLLWLGLNAGLAVGTGYLLACSGNS